MKRCPSCEGVGSVPDAFTPESADERKHRVEHYTFLSGWIVTILVSLAAFVHGCPPSCAPSSGQYESRGGR